MLPVRRPLHIEFSAVDSMTCVQCRSWRARLEELEVEDSKKACEERSKLEYVLEDHANARAQQRRSHDEHEGRVLSEESFAMLTMDGSTKELMNRGKVHIVNVTLCERHEDGTSLKRSYFDFYRLPLSGRKRDALYYVLSYMFQNDLCSAKRVVVWADAGSSDFHNAPAMYSFVRLANYCAPRGIVLESLNFFAVRHGWSDCDRHFGKIEQSITQWYSDVAPKCKGLFLDVDLLRKLTEEKLRNTRTFDCQSVHVIGTVCPPVPSLNAFYSFEPAARKGNGVGQQRVVAKVWTSSKAGIEMVLDGKLVSHEEAEKMATHRLQTRPQVTRTKKKNKKKKK